MTRTIEIIPSQAIRSDCNERQEDADRDSEEFQNILKSAQNGGISSNPLARMEDGEYAIVDGWNRVKAAEEAGFDKIEIDLQEEMNDVEAMKKSLYGNMEEARIPVEPAERALHITRIREAMSEEGDVSKAKLAEEIGVSRSTLQRWLEPLSDDWEDTLIDPTSENEHVHSEHLRNLSGRKLSSIRKTTEGGERGEWLALQTFENDLTIQELSQVRDYYQDGVSLEDAVAVVTGDKTEEDIGIEAQDTQDTDSVQPETTDSPQSPDTPQDTQDERVSKADLSSDGGATAESTSTSTWMDETESIDDPDTVDEGEESTSTSSGRAPMVSEEDKKLAEETPGWYDTRKKIEEATEEDGSIEVTLTLVGPEVDAVEEALKANFEDPETIVREALHKWLREGRFFETADF